MSTDFEDYTEGNFDIVKIVQGSLLTNSYIITHAKSKDSFILDPIKPTGDIKKIISDRNLNLKAVIVTHGHIDHIEGIHDFNLPVMLHTEDVKYLKDNNLNLAVYTDTLMAEGDLNIKILRDDEIINLGGVKLKVIHTPGHTPGSICLYFQNLLFSGDTLFFDGVGRCDLPGGNQDKIISSIKEKIFTLPDSTKVFPGHGPLTTIGREKKYNPFL